VASFSLVAGTVPAAAARHQVFGSASAGERKFGLAKAWRQKTWWKAGGTHGFIYGDGKEIVALDRGAYPEKFGR
jgi:hypothetical protein